jgi:hypothetical protein
MLTARWWSAGQYIFDDEHKHGWPLRDVEARCGGCGFSLGNGGFPHDSACIRTVLLEAWLAFNPEQGIWEPSRREAKRSHALGAKKTKPPPDTARVKPRHVHGLAANLWYLTRAKLPPGKYPPGTVGKEEGDSIVRWDVALPVKVRCMRCKWLSEIRPEPLVGPGLIANERCGTVQPSK